MNPSVYSRTLGQLNWKWVAIALLTVGVLLFVTGLLMMLSHIADTDDSYAHSHHGAYTTL